MVLSSSMFCQCIFIIKKLFYNVVHGFEIFIYLFIYLSIYSQVYLMLVRQDYKTNKNQLNKN